MNLNGWYGTCDDSFAIGIVTNELSNDHSAYLSARGYGFIIGDGNLKYVPEEILEGYYLCNPLPRIGAPAI